MESSVDFYKTLEIGTSYVMNDKVSDNPVDILFNNKTNTTKRVYLGKLTEKSFNDGAVGRKSYGTVKFEYNNDHTTPVGAMITPNIVEATPDDTKKYLLAKKEAEIQKQEQLKKDAKIEADNQIQREKESNLAGKAVPPIPGTSYPYGTIVLLNDFSQMTTTGDYFGGPYYMGKQVKGVLSTGGKRRRSRNRKSKKSKKSKKTRKSRKNRRKSKRRSRR